MKRVPLLKTPRVRLRKKNIKPRRPAKRIYLTDKRISELRARSDKQYRMWDGSERRPKGSPDVARGLHVLVSPQGTKSFRSTFYFPESAKAHHRHLGRVGEITLDKARELQRADYTKAKAGIDPGSGARSDSYKSAVEDYITRYQTGQKHNNKSTIGSAKTMLLKLSQPHGKGKNLEPHEWHIRRVASIHPTEIQRELDLLRDGDKKRGLKPRQSLANQTFGALRTFFAWCARPSIGHVTVNPMLGIDKPAADAGRRTRSWFSGQAADEAIRKIWRAADKLGGVEGKYVKVLLLTGKRKTGLAEMKWEHIQPDWLWLPPEQGKNKRLHAIPLPKLVQQILGQRQPKGYVFPGTHNGRIHVDGNSLQYRIVKASALLDENGKIIPGSGLQSPSKRSVKGDPSDGFFLHGIRHVVETKLAELKLPPHIRDLLLDHVPTRGSGKVYDHYAYRDEMLAGLTTWAKHVMKITKAKLPKDDRTNVVAFRPASSA